MTNQKSHDAFSCAGPILMPFASRKALCVNKLKKKKDCSAVGAFSN